MKEILYIKDTGLFGYRKISAIKDVGFVWGSEELNVINFGVLTIAMTDVQILDWQNTNKYCVNAGETAIIVTPAEYQR